MTVTLFSILSTVSSRAVTSSLDEKRAAYPNSVRSDDEVAQVMQLAKTAAADPSIVVGQTFSVESPFGARESIVFRRVDAEGNVALADNSWLPGGIEATDAEHRLDENGINNRIARAHDGGKVAAVDPAIVTAAVRILELQREALGAETANVAIAKLNELSTAGKVQVITGEDASLGAFGHYSQGTSTGHEFGEQIHVTETVGDKVAVLVHEAINAVTGVHQTAINYETAARLSQGNPIVLFDRMLNDDPMARYYAQQAEVSRKAGSTIIILAQDVSRARERFGALGLTVSDTNNVKIVNINDAQEVRGVFADVKQRGNLGKSIALVDDFAQQKLAAAGISDIGVLVVLEDDEWDLAHSQLQLNRQAEDKARQNV